MAKRPCFSPSMYPKLERAIHLTNPWVRSTEAFSLLTLAGLIKEVWEKCQLKFAQCFAHSTRHVLKPYLTRVWGKGK